MIFMNVCKPLLNRKGKNKFFKRVGGNLYISLKYEIDLPIKFHNGKQILRFPLDQIRKDYEKTGGAIFTLNIKRNIYMHHGRLELTSN